MTLFPDVVLAVVLLPRSGFVQRTGKLRVRLIIYTGTETRTVATVSFTRWLGVIPKFLLISFNFHITIVG